jgi:hypothetical protein
MHVIATRHTDAQSKSDWTGNEVERYGERKKGKERERERERERDQHSLPRLIHDIHG